MGQRNEASGFNLFSSLVKLIPRLWRCDANLVEHLGVGPDPVHAVNVQRHGHILALILDGLFQKIRQQCVPVLLVCNCVEALQRANSGPFLDVLAFDLRHGGRHTGQHAGAQNGGHGITTTASHWRVIPDAAAGFKGVFQRQCGARFPA